MAGQSEEQEELREGLERAVGAQGTADQALEQSKRNSADADALSSLFKDFISR